MTLLPETKPVNRILLEWFSSVSPQTVWRPHQRSPLKLFRKDIYFEKVIISITKCFSVCRQTCSPLPGMLWWLSLCCSLGDDCMVVDSGPPDTECWLFWVECGFWMFAACVCCMRHRDRCLRSICLCGINCVWNLMRLRQFKVFLGVFWSAQWVLVWQTKAEDKVAENVSLYPNFPLAQRCPYCVVKVLC